MNCAFLSIANTAGWFIDDDLVHPHLQSLGWHVQNIPWDSPVDWNAFDLVLIRSPWDYQDHLTDFIAVLNRIEASRAVLLNPLHTVLWNIDKKYLFELEDRGVELVPTVVAQSLEKSDIDSAFDRFSASELIVKPMIGANADDTFRIPRDAPFDFESVTARFRNRECMIQPFMQHIVEEGEYSLMYFNGKLSHTILKTVRAGDYRVQEEHGGGVVPIEKPDALLTAQASKAMNALGQQPLYARVDLVRTAQNTFALMELELIEPCLYFRFDKNAAKAFAECIHQTWNTQNLHSRASGT